MRSVKIQVEHELRRILQANVKDRPLGGSPWTHYIIYPCQLTCTGEQVLLTSSYNVQTYFQLIHRSTRYTRV